VRELVERHAGKPQQIFNMLRAIQNMVGYLSPDSLKAVADATGRSLVDIYGFATFHKTFRLIPNEIAIESESEVPGGWNLASARCPDCNHDLLDRLHPIDGRPSCRIDVSFCSEDGSRCFDEGAVCSEYGSLWLSTVGDCAVIETEHPIPLEGEVEYFCPHCSAEIINAGNCDGCGAPLVPIFTSRGPTRATCSRVGCERSALRARQLPKSSIEDA
jgi:predicted RNA-binding Zn-ribbon protein involved in translation (DUF1610 family)